MITTEQQDHPALYRHSKRPDWGLAILAWERKDKRGYRFEDGQLRVFKRGFFELLQNVQPPAERAAEALQRLRRAGYRARAAADDQGKQQRISLAAQVGYFAHEYEGGFRGPAWSEMIRGENAPRTLKRHRDPAVARARELLTAEALDRALEPAAEKGALDALIGVLEQTSLVTATQLRPLRNLPPRRHHTFAVALRALLHGDDQPFAGRFDRFARSIGSPSWELATAPLALLRPEQHVCVRPGVFKQQALSMVPGLQHSRAPEARCYQTYLAMARDLEGRLVRAGLRPRDLLDVHDFIQTTLRPAARKQLARWQPPEATAEEASAAEAAGGGDQQAA